MKNNVRIYQTLRGYCVVTADNLLLARDNFVYEPPHYRVVRSPGVGPGEKILLTKGFFEPTTDFFEAGERISVISKGRGNKVWDFFGEEIIRATSINWKRYETMLAQWKPQSAEYSCAMQEVQRSHEARLEKMARSLKRRRQQEIAAIAKPAAPDLVELLLR